MARWLTFIGGFYSRASFCAEAREMGVQRVISRSNARQKIPGGAQGIEWGDIVLCASWGDQVVFAEFVVESLTLNGHKHLDAVALMLAAGQAEEVQTGGGVEVRDCGSYIVLGTVRVTCALQQLLDMLDTSEGPAYKLLIGGPLTQEHDPALTWEEAGVDPLEVVRFRRGLIPLDSHRHDQAEDATVRVITGYKQRKKKARQDIQARMPFVKTEEEEVKDEDYG